jgi:hypothetical protein
VQGRHFDDATPKFHESVDMEGSHPIYETMTKNGPTFTAIKQGRGDGELSELPKIKRVSIAPRLEMLDMTSGGGVFKRAGMTPNTN